MRLNSDTATTVAGVVGLVAAILASFEVIPESQSIVISGLATVLIGYHTSKK